MSKHIVVIDSSPRPGRNTDKLCDAFIRGTQEAGNTTYKFSIAGKKVNGCIHCMQCYKNGPCSQKDDMIPLYEQLEKADMVVFATPVYFYDINAQMKCIIDRMYALFMAQKLTPKDTAFFVVCGGTDREKNLTESLNFYHNVIIDKLHWNDKGVIEVTGTTPPDYDIEKAGKLEEAYQLGLSLHA